MPITNRAIGNVAATAMLQTDKGTLESPLMVRSCLRELGDILEGSLQQFIRLRLKMLDVCGRRQKKGKAVEQLTFGEVIDEILNNTNDRHIYAPPPFNVAVNQWRNIANHNSYEVVGKVVCCAYGQYSNRKQFQCTPEDIVNVACYFNDLCFAHKVAIEIFGIDNMQEMTQWVPSIELSDYTKNTALAFGLRDHGFSVRLALQEPDKWKLIVIDQHNRDSKAVKAALHEACVAYALLNGAAHLEFSVHSSKGTARIGFKISFQKKGQAIATDFSGTVRGLDKDFRLLGESGG
jgi:hypothetical protein